MNDTKEKILLATLDLSATYGLGAVSMGMIADKVGIKKPSIYNHFSSKEALIEAMYAYLRGEAKKKTSVSAADYRTLFAEKSAFDILKTAVEEYGKINRDPHMRAFYKILYSERCRTPSAAKILAEETATMIAATKQLFYAMQVHGLLHFHDPDMSALSFAMTIHALTDYAEDLHTGNSECREKTGSMIQDYLLWFCQSNGAEA